MTGTPEDEYKRRGNDYLREQLGVLRKDKKLLRRLTLLSVRCRRCHDVVLEVIATRPWWIVVRHSPLDTRPIPDGFYDRPAGMGVTEFASVVRERREARGGGENNQPGPPGFFPIFRAAGDDAKASITSVVAVCRCHRFDRSMTWLYAELDKAPKDGRSRVVGVSPPASTG